MESWQWFQVGVSTLTTLVIIGGLVKGWPWRERDRLLVVTGCALLVCGSALAFVYTRDRLGLAGGIGYALLLYVACASWLESVRAYGWQRRIAPALVTLVAVLWTVRSVELWFQLRDTAWDYHVEWTDRFQELGGTNQTDLMRELRAKGLEQTPPDPRRDPAWTYLWFERRFHRSP
jgi:drug/metabolite transporter (DMT)-like permease